MAETTVSDRLRRAALIVWTAIGVILLAGVTLWVAEKIRIIWLPLAFAGGLVVILEPVVRRLVRRRVPRVLAVAMAFLLLVGILIGLGFVVVPVVQSQTGALIADLPALYDQVLVWLADLSARVGFDLGAPLTSATVLAWIQDPTNQKTLQDLIGGFGSGAGKVLRGVAEGVAVAGLAPVLAFYLLLDLPRLQALGQELTPSRLQPEVRHVGGSVATALSGFVRGQLVVALVVGILSSLAMWILGLPFWLIIGMTAGILNLVPFIGPVVGAGLAAIVALFVGRPGAALIAIAAFTLIQQLDNHIITPMIQRARVNLSPFTIVIALVVGGTVAGLLGVVLAVPVATTIRILVGHWWRTRVLGESWAEAQERMIEMTEPPERLAALRGRVGRTAGAEVGADEA